MFGNAFDAMNQQAMNQQANYLTQLGQASGWQSAQGMQNTQPVDSTNPDDRLIVLLTEV